MSLPAADLPVSIAVLVLAWDEATPAVRALVEATQAPSPAVDSILVMVPRADAPDHLSAEEYLPLPADTPAPTAPAPLATADGSLATKAAKEPAAVAVPLLAPGESEAPIEAAEPTNDAAAAPLSAPHAGPDPGPALPAPAETIAAPPPAWAAVRVLRLASHSLPQLARRAGQPLPALPWLGPAQWPAEPYLGATPLAGPASAPPTASPAPAPEAASSIMAAGAETPTLASAIALVQTQSARSAAPMPAVTPVVSEAAPAGREPIAPLYEPAEALPQGTLETDLLPAAEEANELEEAPSQDLFQEADFTPNPAQAGWPAALAALRQPAPLAPPAAVESVSAPPPTLIAPVFGSVSESASPPATALRPAATHYPAPDLNYQVIQYARFAVPVALAEADFAAIYAPAWPTWLAAQELRQRTGRPLVLHVAALAAGAEPAGIATGWMADLQRQALLRADLILTETPALAERLRRELGLPLAAVQAVAAADATGIAQALHAARPRPVAG